MAQITRAQVMALLATKAPPARRRLEAAALQRVLGPLTQAIAAMPAARLHEVVAGSAVLGAARVLEAASLREATHDPLAPARGRAARRRAELVAAAGGLLARQEVMARTGVSHQTVSNWRRTGAVIALPRGRRDFVYPACQVTDTGLVPGLAAVLRACSLRDPWSRLGLLLTPSTRLGGRSPLEALHHGEVDAAAAAARAAGTVGDAGAPKVRRRAAVASR